MTRLSRLLTEAVAYPRVMMGTYEKAMRARGDDLLDFWVQKRSQAKATAHDPKDLARRAADILGSSSMVQGLAAGEEKQGIAVFRALAQLGTDNPRWNEAFLLGREVRAWMDSVDDESEETTAAQMAKDVTGIIAASEKNANAVAAQVAKAVGRMKVKPTKLMVSPHVPWNTKDLEFEPCTSFTVEVGTRGATFTAFTDEKGKVVEVEDVLEGGDTDFFREPMEQVHYFDLVRELKSPGSTQRSGKALKLYTARPVSDRARYERASTVPVNIFLTTDPDRAEGLAVDLAGGVSRDVWTVIIDERYLIQTLQAGRIRDYQTVGDGREVPVKKLAQMSWGGGNV